MQTPVIRYSLKDRGRQHTGQRRNFNIRAICDAINGPACQEAVTLRTMVGFYGHLPRVRYGLNPVEGGIEGGKYAPVEPAFVTTHLRADYEGNVEHRAEFLDTAAGKLAEKLWNSKVGGFSSAIDQAKPEFHGFDFVLAPNFASNSFRGVALDDVTGGHLGELTYDDIYAAEQDEHVQSMIAVLDSINAERDRASEAIERLSIENEQLLSLLAAKGVDALPTLDAAPISALSVSMDSVERMQRDAIFFKSTASLPTFAEPKQTADPALQVPGYARLLNQYAGR